MTLRAKARALKLWAKARLMKVLTPDHLTEKQLINSLTNHERNQWARAGYPRGVENVKRFKEAA